ncbi:hypothetical protein GQ42DRAFT_178861 [Ramicandelaber brevisporus]|nr:hypothetical protein GQ42DRAFT_178861 [Ramicandelaber brevisporus]
MTLEQLRQQVLSSATESKVIGVNQRALVDKLLARYSTEYGVYRELLQNSNDAGADSVEILFETASSSDRSSASSSPTVKATAAAAAAAAAPTPATPAAAMDGDAELSRLQTLLTQPMAQVTVQNNGRPFTEEDWQRIRVIAQGNQAEDATGMFGVGAYTILALTESPFITSPALPGDSAAAAAAVAVDEKNSSAATTHECMAFFWQDEQLHTRRVRATEPADHPRFKWTRFFLPLRDPQTVPNLESFGRFIASSLLFTRSLNTVSVLVNGMTVIKVTKKPAGMISLDGFPAGLSKSDTMTLMKSPRGLFRQTSIDAAEASLVQIDAEYVHRFTQTVETEIPSRFAFWTIKQTSVSTMEKLERRRSSVFLRSASMALAVEANDAFRNGMERSTKKRPPRTASVSIAYMGLNELEASTVTGADSPSYPCGPDFALFVDLVPRSSSQGRVFIGFPTHQTLGISAHATGPFMPTVERENLDFVDPVLRVWNQELLCMAGRLARAVYVDELDQIRRLAAGITSVALFELEGEAAQQLARRMTHTLACFTPRSSTPASQVGTLVTNGLFLHNYGNGSQSQTGLPAQLTLPLLTTCGVLPSAQSHIASPNLSSLLGLLLSFSADGKTDHKVLPALMHSKIASECPDAMLDELRRQGMRDLELRVPLDIISKMDLTLPQAVRILRWFAAESNAGRLNRLYADMLFQVLAFRLTESGPVIRMRDIKSYASPAIFGNSDGAESALPLPSSALPTAVCRHFSLKEMQRLFPSLVDLDVADWASFIASSHSNQLAESSSFCEKVMLVLSAAFSRGYELQQSLIVSAMSTIPCVPTQHGVKVPSDAYFPGVKLFDDLPIVSLQIASTATLFSRGTQGVSKPLLIALGVRSTVDLQLILDRLDQQLKWDHVQLVRYLASIRDTLTQSDLARLRSAPLFTAEMQPTTTSSPASASPASTASASTASPKVTLISAPGGIPVAQSTSGAMNADESRRYTAQQLYIPDDEHRALRLPVIAWPAGRWTKHSDSALLLRELGLRQSVSLDTVLDIAAGKDEHLRTVALRHLMSHFHTEYRQVYRAASIKQRFIKCTVTVITDNGKTEKEEWCAPRDCFTNSGLSILGFPVVDSSMRAEATMLGARADPSGSELRSWIDKWKPISRVHATLSFQYLANHAASVISAGRLDNVSFIPIFAQSGADASPEDKPTGFIHPSGCYFAANTSVNNNSNSNSNNNNNSNKESGRDNDESEVQFSIFTYVDFGSVANAFLHACGVQDSPSTVDLAQVMASDPVKFLNSLGGDYSRYMLVLRQIAVQYRIVFASNSNLLAKFRRADCLVAVVHSRQSNKESASENEVAPVEYKLANASSIYLVDDTTLHRMFLPLSAPADSLLETLYEMLGSKWISNNDQSGGGGRSQKPVRNADWIRNWLDVRQLSDIKVTHSFISTGERHTQSTTAYMAPMNALARLGAKLGVGSGGLVLCIVPTSTELGFDDFDVARVLGEILFDPCRLNDALLIGTLLTTDINALRRKGFNVDRVLAPPPPPPPLPPPPSAPPVSQSPSTGTTGTAVKSSQSPPQLPPRTSTSTSTSTPVSTSKKSERAAPALNPTQQLWFNEVHSMFPNEDPNEIRRNVANISSDEQLTEYVESLLTKKLNESEPDGSSSDNSMPPKPSGPHPPDVSRSTQANSGQSESKITKMFNRMHDAMRSGTAGAATSTATSTPNDTLRLRESNSIPPDHHATSRRMLQHASATCVSSSDTFLPGSSSSSSSPSSSNGGQHISPGNKDLKRMAEQSRSMNCTIVPPGGLQRVPGPDSTLPYALFLESNLNAMEILPAIALAVKRLSQVLETIASVMEIPSSAIHIYYDLNGTAIAFNRGRALFFNARYFIEFGHVAALDGRNSAAPISPADVYFHWFMIAAHELAHNFVGEHNGEHEHYMSILPVLSRTVVFREHGPPSQVVDVKDIPLNPLGPHDCLVRFLASPINPSDINAIEGTYPIKPAFITTSDGDKVAIPGNEGVAEVVALGSNINSLGLDIKQGDWVIPLSKAVGTWRTHAVMNATDLFVIPHDKISKDGRSKSGITSNQAATMTVNIATAYRMLTDFVDLKSTTNGLVIQNAANSGVGRAVIQLAKHWGINTINVVRQRDDFDKLAAELRELGATLVVADTDLAKPETKEQIRKLASSSNGGLKLGLNCVGGKSTTLMAQFLAQGGTLVTYGAMSRQPLSVPASQLIFKDLRFVGFWMTRWYAENSLEKRKEMWLEIIDLASKMVIADPPIVKTVLHDPNTKPEHVAMLQSDVEAIRAAVQQAGAGGKKQMISN